MSDLLQLGHSNSRPKAPSFEDLQLNFSPAAIEELENLTKHYPEKKACVLPGLWIAQREYGGFLSAAAIAEVAYRLERSYAEVEGVATFYSMYNTKHEVGRHMIEVCTCLTCQVCGAYPVAEYLKSKLGIGFGETTEDGAITLHEVECLNACDRAPLLQVGDQYVGPVNEQILDDLIARLRADQSSTVVQMADSIVQVHLGNFEKAGGPKPVSEPPQMMAAPAKAEKTAEDKEPKPAEKVEAKSETKESTAKPAKGKGRIKVDDTA